MKLSIGVLGVLLCWSVPAHAQVRIVAGGPGAKAPVLSSLRSLDADFKVCWRGKRPAQVNVALSVGPRGKVLRSTARTRGAVAQCAAGVLAVQTLPASGRGYRMTVSIPTRRMAAKSIAAALRPHMATLRRCGGSASGRITLRFRIGAGGAISNAQVTGNTVNDAVGRCVVRTANGLRLAVSLRNPVSYSLSLTFDGRSGGGTSRLPPRNPNLTPKKRGPLAGSEISRVVRTHMDKITACYERVARRMRRKPSGRVVIRFTIRGNGTVRNVKVRETTLKNKRVEACIVNVGKTFRFPAEAGRAVTKVWYPFSFRPRP